MERRRFRSSAAAMACLSACVWGGWVHSAHAAASSDNGPWLNALSTAFVLLDLTAGDLDGDGRDETVACYRQDLATTDQASGIVVLQGKGAEARPVFHVQLDGALCEKVRVNGNRLGILLHGNKQLAWTYGKEIRFRGQKDSLVAAKSVTASSTLDAGHGPTKAYDNDLSTSWAEGAAGTGIGQSLTIRLERPIDIGAVALFCGDGSSARAFFDRNRVHRGSIEAKTEADLGDTAAGIDFSALGIDAIGDRTEFNCENKPQITYVHIGKRDVVELHVRIDSVYLGDKKDDTHVAEVEIVPLLDPSHTLDRAREVKKKPEADTVAPASKGPARPDVDVDGPTKALDESGRSVVPNDF